MVKLLIQIFQQDSARPSATPKRSDVVKTAERAVTLPVKVDAKVPDAAKDSAYRVQVRDFTERDQNIQQALDQNRLPIEHRESVRRSLISLWEKLAKKRTDLTQALDKIENSAPEDLVQAQDVDRKGAISLLLQKQLPAPSDETQKLN